MSSTMQSRLLAPLLRQTTVLLTTWDRDGAAAQTPAHIAVAGDHAFIRTHEGSPNNARLRRNPRVTIAPVTTGRDEGAIRATARPLSGTEATIAARAMRRKYPIRHGWLIPRFYRLRGYRTVYYRLDPVAGAARALPGREAGSRTRNPLPAIRHALPTV